MSTTTRDVDIESPGQVDNHKEPSHCSCLKTVTKVVIIVLWALLLFCRFFPLTILSITFKGEIMDPLGAPAANRRKEKERKPSAPPIYKKPDATEHVQLVIKRMGVVTATRLGVAGVIWLVINLRVRSLREAHFLGDPLWKWSILVILVFLLIPSMLVVSFIFTKSLQRWVRDDDDKIDFKLYWIRGVSISMRRVLYLALILLFWVLNFPLIDLSPPKRMILSGDGHFHIPSSERKKVYKIIHEYIFLTLIAFLVWAVIGLIGNTLVLGWKKSVIYVPNRARILVATFRLYLLQLLFPQIQEDVKSAMWILMPYLKAQRVRVEDQEPKMTSLGAPVHRTPIESSMDKMSAHVNLYDIDEAVEWFRQHFYLSHDEIPDVQPMLHNIRNKYGRDADDIIKELVPEDANLQNILLELLGRDLPKNKGEKINWSLFEEWMKFAHKKCFAYMQKIHGDLQVASSLDKILSAFQIVVTFIFWLFVTKLATTKLIITLGSLFVGLSVMFTETFKTFVDGVVFSFVIHPFDVGDRVKIKDTKLEVRRMYILSTRFLTMENPKDEIIIYPNSIIAKEKIIRLKEDEDGGVSRKNDGDSKLKSLDETNKDDQTPSEDDDG